jgi:hypothetical protein
MNQAIRWLMQGISAQTKQERAIIAGNPIEIPTRDETFRDAIKILQDYDSGELRYPPLYQDPMDE